MKKNLCLFIAALLSFSCVFAQNIGIGTNTPDASALLDIKSNTKGLLIPRTSTLSRLALLNPAKGLILYDTTTNSFWFHNGAAWAQLSSGSNGWNLNGNAGTNASTDFIGTTDLKPLRFRVNNTWAGTIDTTSGNIFLGISAGQTNTTGQANMGLGDHALFSNLSGSNNTAIGYQSLHDNQTGFGNTANGWNAMYNNVAGSNATAVGTNAMLYSNNTTTPFTNFNVAVGFEALRGSTIPANNTGMNNTAIGYQALLSNTSGTENTAVGLQSLFYNTTGYKNTAIGQGALYTNDIGVENTANGYGALAFNTHGSYNIAFGNQTLYSNQTGQFNSALGSDALYSNTTGNNNCAVGSALSANRSGSDNCAMGYLALDFNTTATENVAIGTRALYRQSFNNQETPWSSANVAIGPYALENNQPSSTLNGVNNTAVGYVSLNANSTGHENTAFGSFALVSNQTGLSNTAAGYAALYNNAIGSKNTAMGQGALYANNADDNTAFGYGALSANTSGGTNTAVGKDAMLNNTKGFNNTAIGFATLRNNTAGGNNVAIGAFALNNQSFDNGGLIYTSGNVAIGFGALSLNNPISMTTGEYNTAIGYNTLQNNITGSGNVALGYTAGPQTGDLSNTTCIGNGASATANNQIVLGNAAVTQFYCYGAYVGTTANAPNLTVLNTGQIVRSTSSRRYKKDITPLEINTAAIYKLRPVSYNSYTDNDRHFGLIAEEVADVIPELASFAKEKDVVKGSSSEKLIPDAVQYPLLSVLLLKEVQKHEQTIEELKSTITELKKMLVAQQAQIDALKK